MLDFLLNNTFFSFIQSRIFKVTIFFIPIAIIFLITVIRILFGIDDDFYFKVTDEDGPIENATAIAYFISFIFSLAIAKFFKERKIFLVLFLIFASGFLFIALEEISWGQRIFDFQHPDWLPMNMQLEVNVHNLEYIEDYHFPAFFTLNFLGAFTWYLLPKIHNSIFKKAGNNYKTFLRYAVPKKYLISYFLPIIPIYLILLLIPLDLYLEAVRLDLVGSNVNELRELSLSIGILLFVLDSYIKLKVKL